MSTTYTVNFEAASNEDVCQAFALKHRTGEPVDLTDATLKMDIAKHADAPDLLELTTQNGRIRIVTPDDGQFEIALNATDLAALTPDYYRHDLLLTTPDGTQRVWEGGFTLTQGVTE